MWGGERRDVEKNVNSNKMSARVNGNKQSTSRSSWMNWRKGKKKNTTNVSHTSRSSRHDEESWFESQLYAYRMIRWENFHITWPWHNENIRTGKIDDSRTQNYNQNVENERETKIIQGKLEAAKGRIVIDIRPSSPCRWVNKFPLLPELLYRISNT